MAEEELGNEKKRMRYSSGGNWREPNPANSWGAEIPGFKEALLEAMAAGGIEMDAEQQMALIDKIQATCQKQAKKFYNDKRTEQKMNVMQARQYLGEFVESTMHALSGFMYDKDWFTTISWNGALVLLVYYTFTDRYECFKRVLKTDIGPLVDDGLLAWSEEDRMTKAFWAALEAGGISEGQKKKGNTHLAKSFDEAHFNAPWGTITASGNLSPEVAHIQEFIQGWMTIFANKAYSVFENGLQDSSQAGQVVSLNGIFQTLMNPENPSLPISLQAHIPQVTPWPFIETCAAQVVAEMHGPAK